jgi:sarcosine oxidase subunit gamma
MAEAGRTSPLAHYAERFAECRTAAIGFVEIPFVTQLAVRVDPRSPAAPDAAEVIGGPLPSEPNTTARYDGLDVLWLGPDEWLLVVPDDVRSDIETALRIRFSGQHASLVDVSARRTIIEIAGPAARAVLARGCALDLHPACFGPGRCAQTLIARAHAILLGRGEDSIWLFAPASFAEYLADWLLDASLEDRVQSVADPYFEVAP